MKTNIKSFPNRAEFAHAMIDKYFGQVPNKFVSDIGAGYGHMQQKVEAIGGVWQPFDYVKKMDNSIIWDLNNPAPANVSKAGLVLFLEVLEHLANPLLGIQNIANHTEKGGILILTTPNPQSSKNRLHLLWKGTLYAFQAKHLKEHHVFTPWEHVVRHFLESSGFDLLEYAIVDTAYQHHKVTSFKDAVKFYLEKWIEFRKDKAKGMSYGMVAIKK